MAKILAISGQKVAIPFCTGFEKSNWWTFFIFPFQKQKMVKNIFLPILMANPKIRSISGQKVNTDYWT